MKCKQPFRKGLISAGCTRCLPCRINHARMWTIRLVLEAGQHQANSYVTLTYDEEHHPADGSVSVREAQLFLDRLRRRIGPFRYYIVGEYGELSWRPHYHAALFGVRDGLGVRESWTKGFVDVSGLGLESAAYIAGYVCKGRRNAKEMKWHGKSLHPEFARRSLKPGIGAGASDSIASFYRSAEGRAALERCGGVSPVVRQGRSMWPIGRYLRERIQSGAGLDREALKRTGQLARAVELQSFNQLELNKYIEHQDGIAVASGARAEIREQIKRTKRRYL